jgi:hypothetical protein
MGGEREMGDKREMGEIRERDLPMGGKREVRESCEVR